MRSRSSAALGQVVLYGLMMLAVGGVAFATAPFVGRTRAAAFGLDRAVRLVPPVQLREPVAVHRNAVAPVVLRMDGRTPADGGRHRLDLDRAPRRGRPRPVRDRAVGLRTARSSAASRTSAGCGCRRCRPGSADRSPGSCPTATAIAIAWGVGTGLYGMIVVASAEAFSEMIKNLPQIGALLATIYPGLDLTQPSALLQLTLLRVRLVHHEPRRRVVPRRLVERRGSAPSRGRPVDSALARRAGPSGARSGCWRRSA